MSKFEILTNTTNDEICKSIERIGRVCYKSEDKITEDSSKKFVRKIIESGHHSVIEHVSLTVLFIVDRGVSHELVRHRIASFSQESTRYCNYGSNKHKGVTFVIPWWALEIEPGEYSIEDRMLAGVTSDDHFVWYNAMLFSEQQYLLMVNDLQMAPQAARALLPNSTKTEVVMTANLREWRHVINLRSSLAAHPDMHEIMINLKEEFVKRFPTIFGDL